MKKSLENLLSKSNNTVYDFKDEFNSIIETQIDGYSGNTKEKFKSFCEDKLKNEGIQKVLRI